MVSFNIALCWGGKSGSSLLGRVTWSIFSVSVWTTRTGPAAPEERDDWVTWDLSKEQREKIPQGCRSISKQTTAPIYTPSPPGYVKLTQKESAAARDWRNRKLSGVPTNSLLLMKLGEKQAHGTIKVYNSDSEGFKVQPWWEQWQRRDAHSFCICNLESLSSSCLLMNENSLKKSINLISCQPCIMHTVKSLVWINSSVFFLLLSHILNMYLK